MKSHAVSTGCAGQTFLTLTAGADVKTLTTGNDSIETTAANLGALDVVDGGAGKDTLKVIDSGAVASLGGATFKNVEVIEVSSGASVGNAASGAAAVTAVREIDQLSFDAGDGYKTITYTGTAVEATDKVTITDNTGASPVVYTLTYGSSGWTLTNAASAAVANGGTGSGENVHATFAAALAATLNTIADATVAFVGSDGVVYTNADASEVSGADYALAFVEVATTNNASSSDEAGVLVASTDADALVPGGTFTISYAGVTVETETLDSNPTTAEGLTLIAGAINAIAGTTVANVVGSEVVLTAEVAGTALPEYSVTYNADGGTFLLDGMVVKADSVANRAAAASTSVEASTFDVTKVTGLETLNIAAVGTIVGKATKTVDVTATSTGASVTLDAANDVTVTAKGGVTLTNVTGAVSVTEKGASGAVSVKGGTTVSITKSGSALDTATAQPTGSAYTGNITVGANNSAASNPATSTGYPQVIADVEQLPTGNVTIKNYTDYTSQTGQASRVYGAGTADVYTNGATEVSVATAGAVTIVDKQTVARAASASATAVAGTSTLSSVTLDGINASSTVTSGALTSLKVINTGSSAAVTVTNATTGGHALALTLGNNANDLVVTDDTATSITVSTEAQAISTATNASKAFVDLNAAKATSLIFNNAQAVELTGTTALDGATLVTSVDANGAGKLTLGDITGATKLTSIDASDATGAVAVTIGGTGSYGLTLKGGSGNDVVTIKDGSSGSNTTLASGTSATGAAITTNINLGAGNDSLLAGGVYVTVGAGAVIDGGDGEDTVSASLINGGNSTLFQSFEVLGLNLGSGTFDTDLLTGATKLSLLAQGGTYTNVNTNQALSVDADETAGATTLQFGTAESTGTADSYSISFNFVDTTTAASASANEVDAGVVVIENIETISINSSGTGNITNSINLTNTKARVLTISGDKNLNLDFGANDGLIYSGTSTNALGDGTSGNSYAENYFGTTSTSATDLGGVSLIDASAMTAKLDLDTADVGIAYAGLTIMGGTNNDTIVIRTDATVDAGAGNDIITTYGVTSVTTGAGKDEVIVANNKIAVSNDSNPGTATEAVAKLVTITDAAIGDKIDFDSSDTAGSAAALGSKVDVSSATTLIAALTAMANASAAIAWAVYGGNTYIVSDASASTNAGLSDNDIVVKLTGVYDLSTALVGGDAGLLVLA